MNDDVLGELKNPNGVAIDKYGFYYVADSSKHRIAVFDPQVILYWPRSFYGVDCFENTLLYALYYSLPAA